MDYNEFQTSWGYIKRPCLKKDTGEGGKDLLTYKLSLMGLSNPELESKRVSLWIHYVHQCPQCSHVSICHIIGQPEI